MALLKIGQDMQSIIFVFLFLISVSSFAAGKVAHVKMLRGDVDVLTMGKTTKLKVDDWVEAGAVVKTGEKSFVQLIFLDKSRMAISANSEMKIETFSGKDSGVIDLVRGKIRSQVTKDYLQIKDKDKSKLFIKTQNAVMGVRGTDFDISTNGKNTVTVLYEGEIVFNNLAERGNISTERLEAIVDAGVRLQPRDFSVMDSTRSMPTVPARLNPEQFEALEKNVDLSSERSPSNSQNDVSVKSVVPEGLSGAIVSNNSDVLKSEVGQVAVAPVASGSAADAEGYVKGNLIKPANGSFVHLESGTIIPPAPNSVLDSNTNTYIAGADAGSVAADGSYLPPKNVEITNDGKILVSSTGPTGAVVVKEVPPPSPVVSPAAIPLGAPIVSAGGFLPPPKPMGDIPMPTPGLDTRFNPSGGIINVNDPTRQNKLIDTTIIVTPKE